MQGIPLIESSMVEYTEHLVCFYCRCCQLVFSIGWWRSRLDSTAYSDFHGAAFLAGAGDT